MKHFLLVPVLLVATAMFSLKTYAYDYSLSVAKTASRQAIIDAQAKTFTPWSTAVEPLDHLLLSKYLKKTDGKILRKLDEIDARGWRAHRLAKSIWSGWTWPVYTGKTALRYSSVPGIKADSFIEARRSSLTPAIATDDLSPAEKFDLLIGAPAARKFSKFEWQEGIDIQRKKGSVSKWYGYCHGLAAASQVEARPRKPVDLIAADGKTIVRFYPHDIKALITANYANGLPPTVLVGSRCEFSTPKVDKNGRIISEACWSVNPATFHLALVNQLASAERALVIDSFFDSEVWNYPVYSYSYRYFNPRTGLEVSSLAEATVTREEFVSDPYRKWRSPRAKKIVGVIMDVDYMVGAEPRKQAVDSAQDDISFHNVYKYDLEIDANGVAMGGEWHQKHHPDFLWVLSSDVSAMTRYESAALGEWKMHQPLPLSWRAAATSAAQQGRPLTKILKKMINAAQ